ncbi:MAG: hypothetical protein HKP02_03575 [Xanthomonadales bacterium]|nr:hypothetical protein [Xanthomonadales bacterium]
MILVLLMGAANIALAEPCTLLNDDGKRLACFDAARECAKIDSARDRLACFDDVYAVGEAVVGPKRAATDTEPHSAANSGNTSKVAGTNEEDFGKRSWGKDAPVDFIEATITEVRANSYRVDYLRLDNSQVWREIEDNRFRFKEGMSVTIMEGILGSFDMQVDGVRRNFKVRRVR